MRSIIELAELVKETCKQIKTKDISLEGSGDNLDAIVNPVLFSTTNNWKIAISYYAYKGTVIKKTRLYLGAEELFFFSGKSDYIYSLPPGCFSHINRHNIMNFKTWDRVMRKCLGQ